MLKLGNLIEKIGFKCEANYAYFKVKTNCERRSCTSLLNGSDSQARITLIDILKGVFNSSISFYARPF